MSSPIPDLKGDAAPAAGSSASSDAAEGITPGGPAAVEPDTHGLIEQLNDDRLWLLRQLDSGRWSEWRLDLAALERELGQLLDQARERLGS